VKAGEASRTAEFMALYRAMESSRADDKRLFEDRFAKVFLRPSLRLVLRLSRAPVVGGLIPVLLDLAAPGARSSGITRTRLIDDLVCSALDEGVEQVVILGAGFDCRAYRLPGIERCQVFEVDHPDTLAEKRRRLALVLPAFPSNVRSVAIDFNRQRLEDVMLGSGYAPDRRTCFVWEGVTNYLTAHAVDATFRWFANAATRSIVIFTYVHQKVLTDPQAFAGARRLRRAIERMGEPWTFGLDPADVSSYLSVRGLTLVEDLGATEYRSQYWTGKRGGARGYEFYRVALACVAPPEPMSA
jgi:methyltransferase (TIGR00027 family)